MGLFSPNIIANSLICCAKYNPEGEVIIHKDQRITRAELKTRSLKIAQALVKLGVKKDDKVAFMFHNIPEFIYINYGIQVAGAIPAPMNYRFIPREVEYQADHSDSVVLIYDSIWAKNVEPAIEKLSKVKHFVCMGQSELDNVIDYNDFVNSGEDKDPQVENDWDDVAVMIYTGGTTGFPKGVLLTYGAHVDMFGSMSSSFVIRALTMDMSVAKHQKFVDSLPIPAKKVMGKILRTGFVKKLLKRPAAEESLKNRFRDVLSKPEVAKSGYGTVINSMYPSMPFFHDASYSNLLIGALTGNYCFILPDEMSFDPAHILELIEREKVEILANVPTGWKKLVSFPDIGKYDNSSLRIATAGGGATSLALKKKLLEAFPQIILMDVFGQTEMTPITSFRIDVDTKNLKERSVGKSIVDVRVVDDNGNDVPQGETGEIMYRSSTIMKGYYKDEEKTDEVMQDGWFKGGDLGYIDETGEIRVRERKKECINTGGEKVFPLEVEEILQVHPKIDEVCVIGVPDEEWGSTVRAVVQLNEGEIMELEEIKDFCRDKIAGYKIPRSAVFIDQLPFSPVGKMLRQKVRDIHGQPDKAN